MLSRISLLTHKSSSKKYQQLLKLANPTQTRGTQILVSRRNFSGTQNGDNKPEATPAATQEKAKEQTQDDYNLDEVSAGKPKTAEAGFQKQGDRRQKFQRRDQVQSGAPSGGQLFKRNNNNYEEGSQKSYREQQEEDDKTDDEKFFFEDYKQISNYQVQEEIYQLIKNKIGTTDKVKIQKFYSALQQSIRNPQSTQLLDDVTIAKIQTLILEQRQLDEKSLYDKILNDQPVESMPSEIYNTENRFPETLTEYIPLRYDSGDTQKLPLMTSAEYEEFMDDMQDQLLRDIEINEGPEKLMSGAAALEDEPLLEEEDGGAMKQQEEGDGYVDFINDLRADILKTTIGGSEAEKSAFKFDRVTDDLYGFRDRIALEKEERGKAVGNQYDEDDVDLYNEEHIDRIIAQQQFDKEDEKDFDDSFQGITSDIYSNLRDDVKNQYDQARLVMKFNQQLRNKILYSLKQNKQMLGQTLRQRDKLLQRLEVSAKDFQSDIIPKRVFDFIGHEKSIQQRQSQRQQKKKLAKQYLERKFDHETSNIEVYNQELNVLISHYKVADDRKLRKEFVDRMSYVIQMITKNGAQKNAHTNARLFEFGVITGNADFANQNIKQIVNIPSNERPVFSLIEPSILNQFYEKSLLQNNFNGLGHMLTYLEQYKLDISEWNLAKFKTPLDFNLNVKPNLSNVLIFTKYYTYFHQRRMAKQLKIAPKFENDTDKFTANAYVFNAPSLVDMRALFSYLVESLGSKQAIDPVTKDDALWRIVEFFNSKGIRDIAQYGQSAANTISDDDVAKYLSNRVNDSRGFEKVTHVLLRNPENQNLHNQVLQILKGVQSYKGTLPFSFEPSRVRSAYLRLKAIKQPVSEKSLEYFLFLFKSLQMWPEIIDACENYTNLTGGSADSEIRSYYLAESLLSLPSQEHYYELLKKAVYDGKDLSGNAGYITNITKSHLKDGAIDHAIKFFTDEVAKVASIKKKREDVLIALFDSVYGEVQAKESKLSYDEYKKKYLDTILLSQSLIRESFAVSQLQRVIKDKDYDEIETLFQLALVQKQENAIISSIPSVNFQENGEVDESAFQYLSEKQAQDLAQLRVRRDALQSKISDKDAKAMIELVNFMSSQKLRILDQIDDVSADEIQKVFNLKSKDQVEAILKQTERLTGALTSTKDEFSDYLKSFHAKKKQMMERALKQNMDGITGMREVPDRSIVQDIERTYKVKKQNPIDNYEDQEFELNQYHDYMLHDEIDDEHDPLNIMADAHDETLADMKEELLKAINVRKGKVLQSALKIFNKVQDQQLKTFRLDTVQELDEDKVDPKTVNDSLQKFQVLLNDPRSPVYSAIQTLAQYKGDKDIPQFQSIYRDLEDFLENTIDLPALERERDQLENLSNELLRAQGSIKSIQHYLIKEQQEVNKELVSSDSSSYSQWKNSKDRNLGASLDKKVKELYEKYKVSTSNNKDGEFSRQEKLGLMKDIYSMEIGSESEFASAQAVFPAFYAQDLIIFGIENDSVEAIRLGEKMMSENGYVLDREIQKAVKEYLTVNYAKYQAAVKKTGPIDNTSLYRSVRNKRDEESAPVFYSLDDPYWQEFTQKNISRTQQWRLPSQFVWGHKEHGLAGEVFDVKKVRQNLDQFRKYL